MRCKILVATAWIFVVAGSASIGQESELPDAKSLAFFESKIRPILIRHCYDCHSAEQGVAEGGLQLDSHASLAKGGDRGLAVVPGRPAASLLWLAVSHSDADLKMPPKGKQLAPKVREDLRRWIEMGAPYPRGHAEAGRDRDGNVMEAAGKHWAYQSPQSMPVPEVSDPSWLRDEVDAFVLAKLDNAGLEPSGDATPQVLLRRLHFDLVGLPPSPKSIDQFNDWIDEFGYEQAIEREVDRLLDSDQFGERWGRHWLDVARFAESSGGESNISFPHAWRYRDYVIDAFNDDVPYDRFLVEQIAGDLLPYESDKQRARLLIATGFLAVGTKNLGENNEQQFVADIVDEQIDSMTRAVMASSIACARCHHHKFDPFTMNDYYALAGIFYSTKTCFGTYTSPANQRSGDPLPIPELAGQSIFHASLSPQKFAELKAKLAELEAEWEEMEAAKFAAFAGRKPDKTFTLREVLSNIWRRGPMEGKLETLDETGRAIPLTMGAIDREKIVDVPLLARGEIARPGEIVPRGVPVSLEATDRVAMPANQSGRLELAHWLVDPAHPLTSRVIVNRVWFHLFGSGLVGTPDNFGTTGETPSHPALLDSLSIQFVNEGWSLKRLIRRLVLTRTWRQSSMYRQDAFQVDPENRLLWRMSKRRLEAEAIRDAMLVAAGELDRKRPDGSLVARVIGDRPISLIGLDKRLPTDLDGSVHRSVYLPVIRDRLPDVLDLFDFAEPSLVTGARDQTNVPLQALYLMNSDFVQDRAAAMAERIMRESKNPKSQAMFAFEICFGREPDETELQHTLQFLQSENGSQQPLADFCQAMLSTAEFRNLD